jgi:hypothetical protein
MYASFCTQFIYSKVYPRPISLTARNRSERVFFTTTTVYKLLLTLAVLRIMVLLLKGR